MPELSSEYWKYALIVWTWLGAWTISSRATLTADRSDPVSDPYRGACRSWCVPDLVILVLRSFLTLCIEWLHYMCMASIAVDDGTPAGCCKCGCILCTPVSSVWCSWHCIVKSVPWRICAKCSWMIMRNCRWGFGIVGHITLTHVTLSPAQLCGAAGTGDC